MISMHDEQPRRLAEAMKRQLGIFCPLVLEYDVVELMLNADGQLWVDRLGQPMIAVGRMAAVAAESFMFNEIQAIVEREKLPDRSALPLFDAALGLRLTNIRYRAESELTEFGASRDLRRLCEVGLLDPKGERRGRIYFAAKPLVDLRNSVRRKKPLEDPYDLVAKRRQARQEPRLPGL